MPNNNYISYCTEIVASLTNLGGIAKLNEIYDCIAERNLLSAIHSNPNWRNNVRTTIQRHCSTTKSYHGADDLFYPVYGLYEGIWGLNSFETDNDGENITPVEKRIIKKINDDDEIDATTKRRLIDARVGQGYFRQQLLCKYDKCPITGIDDTRLLVASHIKPWRSANNQERLSVENGLILSALYDKLFDKGLITFSDDMRIIVSDSLSESNTNIISINTEQSYIANPSHELRTNMEYHRDVVFIH